MKEVKGKITISKISSTIGDEYVTITVSDRKSGRIIVKSELTLENFALAITGQGHISADLKVFDNYDKVGLKKEIKYIHIPYEWNIKSDFREEMAIKTTGYENDGWEYQSEDYNHHNNSNGWYKCAFVRYLEVEV